MWSAVEVLPTAPSTNAELVARARKGAPAGTVIVAEHQTAGRGRLDRAWDTPARAALTFSFLVAPDPVPASRWPWLPLITGIAVSEAVRRTAHVPAGLKWPNDVLVSGRKLAGILVERIETEDGPKAVIGVGLNVSTTEQELPLAVRGTATSLAMAGASTVDRSVLLRAVLRSFEALYGQWLVETGDVERGLHEAYQRRCVTIGQQVRVELPAGERATGEAVGIDLDGRLLISGPDGTRMLGAGDVVHVRPADGPSA